MNEISVVIPHYGDARLLERCLGAIYAHTAGSFEVVVIDNGTGVAVPEVAIRNPRNEGFAVACNQGALVARHDRILFLNNDTEVRRGWLRPLVAALGPDVAAVGALLLYPDGGVQHGGVDLYREGGLLTAANRHDVGERRDVEAVTAACMLVDRSKFLFVGMFDQNYWNGYEDVDLCLRFRRAGWRIRYEPTSVVTHRESLSGRERWTKVRENVARLNAKWADYEAVSA